MENETPNEGMDRRSMLKRSAIVGGALVWTTPVVQSIAKPAFAGVSDVTIIGCPPGSQFRVKFEAGEDNKFATPTSGAGDKDCLSTAGTPAPAAVAEDIEVTVLETKEGGEALKVQVKLPEGFTLLEGFAKSGSTCDANSAAKPTTDPRVFTIAGTLTNGRNRRGISNIQLLIGCAL